jgi:hypothetical protein
VLLASNHDCVSASVDITGSVEIIGKPQLLAASVAKRQT